MSGAGATRMRALVAAVATIGLVAGTGQTGLMAAPSTAAPIRPNIIFILTDDLDAQSIRTMPQLNTLLVNQDVSLASFFVTTSLCCPSRSSILRGEYVHNH